MDETPHASLVQIGDCTLDRRRGMLLRGGEIIPIRAKTFALLNHLAENRGRVVSKDELLAAIWPDVVVSEDSLTQCVRDLRKTLGDETQFWLRTVSRRGYLLADAASSTIASTLPSTRSEPIVAVLPFTADGADSVLIDGITEEITNGIALFRTVTVIARASAFSFPVAGRPLPSVVGEKLGADYLVEGSFRAIATGFRVSVTLMHAATSRQVWGERFDCTEAELLDVDTLITRRIVTRLVANIEESPLHRSGGTSSLAAFEFLARGRILLRGYGDHNNLEARDNFQRAIEIDPDFGLAHAYLALAEIIVDNYSAAPRPVLERARDRIGKAIALSPTEARCYRIMGLARLYLREHEAAERNLRRALMLNPYDADTLVELGFVLAMRGQAGEALRWAERAIELNPYHPPWYDSDIAFIYYSLGNYRAAIAALERIPEVSPYQELRLSACHAMAGDLPKSVQHLRAALAMKPDLDPTRYIEVNSEFEQEADLRHLLDGVTRAEWALRETS